MLPHTDTTEVVIWTRVVTKTPAAWFQATLPKGIRRVEIWGAVDVDHHFFSVEINPPAFGTHVFRGNAFNLWTVQNMIMYETVLDPDITYTIKVTAMEDGYLDLSQFKLFPGVTRDGPGVSLSTGAIAGIAVGGGAALLVACLLLWFFASRRKGTEQAPLTIDIESDSGHIVDHTIEPYRDAQPAGNADALRIAQLSPPASSSHLSSGSGSDAIRHSGLGYSVLTPIDARNSEEHGSAADPAKEASPPVTVQHVDHSDGGAFIPPVPGDTRIVTAENPPHYNPEWAPTSAVSLAPGRSAGLPSEARISDSAPAGNAG